MKFRVKKTVYKKVTPVPFMKRHPLLRRPAIPQVSIKTQKTHTEQKLSQKPPPPSVLPHVFDFSKKLQNPRMPRIQAISTPKKSKYRDLNIIFLVLNCKNNDYRRKKQNWLKALPSNFKFFHIQGDPFLPVTYQIDQKENLITLHRDDGYLGIPYKLLAAMKVINHHFDYDYIFKTDDDITWENFSYLRNLQKNLAENPVHYGGADPAKITKKEPCYCHQFHDLNLEEFDLEPASYYSGNFYILNKNIVNLLTNVPKLGDKKIEDHAIGECIYKFSKYFKNLNIKTLTQGKELPYYYNYDGMGFYFNPQLKKIINYNKLSFCIFNNKRLLDNIEIFENSDKPSCFFLHNRRRPIINRTICNRIIDNFSHFEKNDWWDIIYFVNWDQNQINKNKKTPTSKEERLMLMKNANSTDFSKIENPCCDFILSRSGIKTMEDYLLNNIFKEKMLNFRVFVMPPLL